MRSIEWLRNLPLLLSFWGADAPMPDRKGLGPRENEFRGGAAGPGVGEKRRVMEAIYFV